ncbi:ClpXP protease specificity-enhancing factor [Ferriphaselus sp. R-1]|uniref:ClpXP protease specificity-enhancing factor n=1 Tax=Ferriphaselus sp. R-1 TaxID=1485544 RepID=UPI0005516BC9|nr:ClpXP protease specificity-enhancing factor [Ferriphaselus sp. R-1]
MDELSTKPYLIRAIYEWCTDSGLTPYLHVRVDDNTRVPQAYIRNGEIVLNISLQAVSQLQLGNEEVTCSGRFGGVSHKLFVPIDAVIGIYAKENGNGLVFQEGGSNKVSSGDRSEDEPPDSPHPPTRPHLRVVK